MSKPAKKKLPFKPLQDDDEIWFGQHSGTKLSEIPASYFWWLWTNGKKGQQERDPIAEYIWRNIPALKKEHPDGIWT